MAHVFRVLADWTSKTDPPCCGCGRSLHWLLIVLRLGPHATNMGITRCPAPAGAEVSKKDMAIETGLLIGILGELERSEMTWNEMKRNAMNEWMDGWMDEWMNESINQSINESINEYINQLINEWMNEQTNQQTNEWMTDMKWHETKRIAVMMMMMMMRMMMMMKMMMMMMTMMTTTTTMMMMIVDVVPMMMWLTWWLRWWCGCHDGAKPHVADLTFPKCSEPDSFFFDFYVKALATVSCAFCRPHLPKVLRARQFCTIFMWNRALTAVSCAFCRPHLPKVLQARQFLRFLCDFELCLLSPVHFVDPIFHKFSVPFSFFTFYLISYLMMMWFTYECEVSLQSRAPFADLIFPKCSEPHSFLRFLYDVELSLQSCALFSTSPIEPRTCGNRDPPSAAKAATLPEKTKGFAPNSVFKPEFTRPISYTSQLLDDDVVAMMMWLTGWLPWWFSCHDGEKAGHDKRP